MLKNMPSAKVLQTFECAARLKSFTLAAKELFLTQSAISRQIKGLEDTLGFKVFTRDNNRLLLTEDGQVLYQVVSKALSEVSTTVDRLRKGESSRRLLIAVPPTFASRWLAPRLGLFHKICPVTITISTHKNLSYSSFGEYDCQVGFGAAELASVGGKLLFTEKIVPACSPDIRDQILAEKDVENIPLLHTLTGSIRLPYWEQWLDKAQKTLFKPSKESVAKGIEFSTQDQTIIAAINGLGVAMVDQNTASSVINKGSLVPLGDSVNTIYGYYVFPPARTYIEEDPSTLFYEWIQDEALESILEM